MISDIVLLNYLLDALDGHWVIDMNAYIFAEQENDLFTWYANAYILLDGTRLPTQYAEHLEAFTFLPEFPDMAISFGLMLMSHTLPKPWLWVAYCRRFEI